jgi:hypothetical protein
MGAFNEWVRGSFLENPDRRRVATVARNILQGAAAISQANLQRFQGDSTIGPLQIQSEIKEYLA